MRGPLPYAECVKPLMYRQPSGHLATSQGQLIVARTKKEAKHMARFPVWEAVPFEVITVSAWEARTDGR